MANGRIFNKDHLHPEAPFRVMEIFFAWTGLDLSHPKTSAIFQIGDHRVGEGYGRESGLLK